MTSNPGTIFVVVVVCIVALTTLMMFFYKVLLWLDARKGMSSDNEWLSVSITTPIQPLSPDETNPEIGETPQRIAEIRAESFTLGETEALARLVASGKLGLTDAVKIGADAKSGEKYQRRSREIKAEVERLKEPQYPALAATRKPSVVER